MKHTDLAPTAPSTRWNRCTTACGCANVNVTDAGCTCKGGCERGKKERAQMRRYAADVLASLGLWDEASDTATCPLTGLAFNIADGEVDKVNPEGGYTPGNVVLTSRIGNQERGKVQQWHAAGDLADVARYAADVARASMDVSVTRFCHLRNRAAIVARKGEGGAPDSAQANVLAGPYGVA